MQSQTSNTLHNAIMEAGRKDRPLMLALGNYVQWKSIIKRYIDTKPNHELIYCCLKKPPYKFTWADKEVPFSEGGPVTRTETYMETYKTVSQDIRDQLNAEAEAVQIILTGIDNDIYSTVDACPIACEMWKAIERGKAIVNSPQPIYDQEPSMVAEDDETSKDKEIDKLMDLISLSFNKIYKPTNNNLRTSSNTSRANQDNSPRINRSTGYENQRIGNVVGARETVGSTVVQKSRIQCYNCKEFGHVARECQKPKRVKDRAYHREKMLLCKQEEAGIQLNAEQADWRDDADDESEDQELEAHYIEHPEQSESVHDTCPIEQDEHNVIIDSLDMSYDREQIDQNDDVADLANEHELLASLIEKLKCEIDDSKNRNKFLETSNKVLIEKLKGEIKYFKNKNKSLESSNNRFKEANNKLSEKNKLLYNDFKKSQAELARRNDVEYASKVEIDCAKARGDLISYKMESQKSFNKYTQTINNLNQTISEMKKKLCAHQETISILSQQKEAQIKLYKTREDKELDKVIALENKVKVLDNIVYKTAPESDEVIRLEKESRSKLSDLIRPFDYDKLNNLYDLFVPQCEKSYEQRYFLERSRLSHTTVNNGNSKDSFNKQTTLLEKRMDKSIPWDKRYPFIKNTIKANFSPEIRKINADLEKFHVCLHEEMVADLRYFNSLELEVDSLRSQLETQKTRFLNEIDRLSREYYYVDHMNAILGVYIELDEVTNLQLSRKVKNEKSFKENQSKEFRKEREQYFKIQNLKAQLQDKGIVISELKKLIAKMKGKYVNTKFKKSSVIRQPNAFKIQRQSILGKPTIFLDSFERRDFSKSKSVTQNNMSNDFSKPVTVQTLPPNKKSILKNTNVLAQGMYKLHTEPTQTRTS
nr:hypothetical protein [Tanacetum cinerariifolium]